MIKRRAPSSPEKAFAESILALGPAPSLHDPNTYVSDWKRAAELTGRSVTQLYQSTNPDQGRRPAPIYQRDCEIIDRVNAAEGRPAHNLEALLARHQATLEGRDIASPELHLQRAIMALEEALSVFEAGHGDSAQTHSHATTLNVLLAELLKVWNHREEEGRKERDRRSDDPKPRPGPPRPRLVKGGDK